MSEPVRVEVLRHGRWRSGDLSGHVWIVRQDWDYFHEDFFEDGPDLGADGWAYYALYGTENSIEAHSSRSQTCLSADEAVKEAESKLAELWWD